VEPNTLDPHFMSQLPEFNVMLAIFDTLGRFDENLNPSPNLATEWEMIDDLTWEFTLREGVVAHNGETIDANDVVFSFERCADPDTGAIGSCPYTLANIRFDGAEVVDDYRVRIHTQEPIPELRTMLTQWYVLPQEYYEATPIEDAALAPIGSGPYRFVEWRRGDELILEANEDYWDGAPPVQRVIWRAVPEASVRIAELNTGGADIIVNVPPDLASQVDTAAGQVVPVQGMRRIYAGFVFYGPNAEFIQDARVRQALNHGFDFQTIIDSLLDGNGTRTGTFVNPPNQAPGVSAYPYDPERARELLAEAGYEDLNGDGFVDYPDGQPLQLTMQSPNGRFVKDIDIAQAIAADLRRTGVSVEVESMEFSIYANQVATKELTGDIFLYSAGTVFFCQGDLADMYTPAWDPGEWNNTAHNSGFEELNSTIDPERREELCYELQENMWEDPPMLFLYFQVDYYGISNRLEWTPLPTERILVRDVQFVD
jgi:peptide/nickel transport system substrate-binding protein